MAAAERKYAADNKDHRKIENCAKYQSLHQGDYFFSHCSTVVKRKLQAILISHVIAAGHLYADYSIPAGFNTSGILANRKRPDGLFLREPH